MKPSKTSNKMKEIFKQIQLVNSTVSNDAIDSIRCQLINASVERIILESNLLPIQYLRLGIKVAESVCHIRYKKGQFTYVATGFMISPSLMMTNHHVFETLQDANDADAYFRYEEGVGGQTIIPLKRKITPEKFYYSCEELDLAIVGVDNEPGNEFGFIQLLQSPDKIGQYERVNIIQHPRGRKMELSLQDNKVTRFTKNKIHYLTDTEEGSSGSPVFNNKWQVVALHHWGSISHNEGIRISAICNHLQQTLKKDSSDWGDLKYCNELLNHIH